MYRQIHTSIWAEPWFMALSERANHLLPHLIFHPLTDLTGFSSASFQRLAHDTKIPVDGIVEALNELQAIDKVRLFPDLGLLWVVRLWRWQKGGGPKFLKALLTSLTNLPPEAQAAFLSQYPWDTVSHTLSYTVSDTPSDRVSDTPSKNPKAVGFQIPGSININESINESRSRTPPPPTPQPPSAKKTTTTTTRNTDTGDTGLGLISRTYENEIGMLTPHIADQLKNLYDDSPDGHSPDQWADWIVKAINYAATQNIRKLSYIQSTLKGWQAQGWQMKSKVRKGGRNGTYSEPPAADATLRALRAAQDYEPT